MNHYTDWPDGLTQAEVIRITGQSRKTVSNWFRLGMIPDEFAKLLVPATGDEQKPADPPRVETVTTQPASRAVSAFKFVVCLAVVGLAAFLAGQYYVTHYQPGGTVPAVVTDYQLGRNAGLNYADLVCSEVLDKLQAANDGNLKSVDAKRIIEVAIPIIQKNTWTPVTDRLTQLQQDGKLKKEELDKAIDEVRKGLKSCR